MIIGINFTDNDFVNTYRKIGEIMSLALNYHSDSGNCFTKEQILYILNEITYGTFLLFQDPFKYDETNSSEVVYIKEYLKKIIKIDQILLEDAVYEYLIKNNFNVNCEMVVIDTNLSYQNNNAVEIY